MNSGCSKTYSQPHSLQRDPFCYYSGAQWLHGAPVRMVGPVWGPWCFKRAHLAAGSLICIPRKFTTVTPHRRVRGPRGPLLSTVGALVPIAWLHPPGYAPIHRFDCIFWELNITSTQSMADFIAQRPILVRRCVSLSWPKYQLFS